jgi:RNA polymerase sigma-70 factor, ECF subfamily
MGFHDSPASSPSTSTGLILRLKANDPAAWEDFVNLFGPLVFQWLRRSGLQSADASDVMQEVFRGLTRSIEGYVHRPEVSSFRSWLWVLTRSRLVDWVRALDGRPHAAGGTTAGVSLANIPMEEPPDEEGDLPNDKSAALFAALETLQDSVSPHVWKAFWLTTVEDRSPDDVAAALGMNVVAVYQAKSRLLRKLRGLLEL